MYAVALAYRGTANNAAVRRLLHFAVSDVSDDVRRAAVLSLVLLAALALMPRLAPTDEAVALRADWARVFPVRRVPRKGEIAAGRGAAGSVVLRVDVSLKSQALVARPVLWRLEAARDFRGCKRLGALVGFNTGAHQLVLADLSAVVLRLDVHLDALLAVGVPAALESHAVVASELAHTDRAVTWRFWAAPAGVGDDDTSG